MDTDADIARHAARAAADWRLGWAFALGLAALAWPATALGPWLNLAFAWAAMPGLVGQLLRWRSGWLVRALDAFAWPIGIGAALALTGGIAGPLAPLAVAPAAAMTALDGRRSIALTAILTFVTLLAVAFAAGAGLIDPPVPVGAWPPFAAISLSALGLAAALLMTRARSTEREAVEVREAIRLRAMLEAGPQLQLRLDTGGAVRELFAGAPEDWDVKLLGRPFETLACDADRWAAAAAFAAARRTGAASLGFAPPLAPDRFLAVELRGLPGGEVLALIRDASRERAYEAFLEQGKKDAEGQALAKSRFLANMSHELRTPLNAIIGFSDIMRSKLFGPLSERYSEYAGLIHESGGHLLDLINDVLDISKIEAERFNLTLEPFDAREAVAAALRLTRVQADAARIALRGALPPAALDVVADRRAIKQLVLNLISNALKFTPAGGQVNVLARRRGRDLEIIVADTGIGIAPEDLERLGRPYEQAGDAEHRSMGTGLGLSLVRAFAELHGGTMTLSSVLGEGTAVSVRMPVIDTEATLPPPALPPEPPLEPVMASAGGNVIAFKPSR